MFSFNFSVFLMMLNDKISNWVIVVYDTGVMQNVFQGEIHIAKCYSSQQGEKLKSIFVST